MILVDLGNTNTHLAKEEKGKLVDILLIRNEEISKRKIKYILRWYKEKEILLCSVAPSFNHYFLYPNIKTYLLGKDIFVPIDCLYNIQQVGMDRLVNAFAVKSLYPRVKIVIDLGTAITIDFISSQGAYLGGIILPGINLYLNSLGKCELLPKRIYLKKYKLMPGRIPKDTQTSILKGVKEGFPFMFNAFVKKYKRVLKIKKEKVIITGGDINFIDLSMLEFKYLIDPLLTLKGLLFLKERIKN